MLNVNFLENSLGIVFPPHFVYDFVLCYVLLMDQVLFSGRLYFLRYWAIFVWHGAKVEPRPQDTGPQDPRIRDPGAP